MEETAVSEEEKNFYREIEDPFDVAPDEESYGKLDPFSDEGKTDREPQTEAASYEEKADLKVLSDGDCLLALVTKETTLRSDYEPADLGPFPEYMFPSRNMELRKEALVHLEKLWRAAEADGVILHIRSAYRSYEYQRRLFQNYAEKYGEEAANRFSARPGQSEHQLGTAVDFGGTDVDFTAAFAETPQGRWLAENAHRFGFALSYPENKEHITGYIYEPWHYRYIGVDAAHEWEESGKTLKEFLKTKPQSFE